MSAADQPYVFASGDTWGEERPAPEPYDLPPRRLSPLLASYRRARTDPKWGARDEESKGLLIALDVQESRRP